MRCERCEKLLDRRCERCGDSVVRSPLGASTIIERPGRLTVDGRRGARTVQRVVLYVSPETALALRRRAAVAGKTMSDFADEVLAKKFRE